MHDGTHGVGVNARIKVRDQIRSPSAGDVQALLRELPGVFFGLTGDVKRAHRLVKIAMKDWGAQACRTGVPNADRVWVNKVGTFESARRPTTGPGSWLDWAVPCITCWGERSWRC